MSRYGGTSTSVGQSNVKVEVGFDEYIRKFTEGLFGVLFITNKNSSHNLTWHFLEVIIDHLQDLAFPIAFTLVPWQKEIEWLQTILSWVSPERAIGTSTTIYILIMCSLGLVLLNAFFVGYMFSQNRFRFIWMLKFLRGTLGLFATILYIPILSFFTDIIIGCEDHEGPAVCWTSSHIFTTVLTFVISLIFVWIALAVKATFFDPDPKIKDVTCRPHSRIEMLYLACRTVLTVLCICLEHFGDTEIVSLWYSQWIMVLTCLGASSLLSFAYFWYVPFYNLRYSCLRSTMMNIFLWASLCMAFTQVRPESDIGIIFVILTPVVIILSVYAFQHRLDMIRKLPMSSISDPFLLELKARLKLIDNNLLYVESDQQKILNERSPGDINTSATSSPTSKDCGPTKAELDKQVLDEVNEMYIKGLKLMPRSSMLLLFSGVFQLNQLNNRAQCLAVHAKAAGLSPKLDEAFMIFRRQRLLNERFDGGDVIDFIAFEQNLQLARKNEKKATVAVVQFWSELLKKHPSFHKLQSHGAAIASAISLAQSHYITLIKLSPDAPHIFRLYGNFLINVLNDTKQGQELLDHAEELEAENDRNAIVEGDTNFEEQVVGSGMDAKAEIDLFSDDNGLLTLSGELSNLGVVINANQMALKLFGYRRNELVGQAIDKIIPEPFASLHDTFLRRYLETGFAKVIDRSRQILGINRDGFLMPFILHVKHMVDTEGKQTFVGVCKPAKENANFGFMILDEQLNIKHFTANLGALFNTKPNQTNPAEGGFLFSSRIWFPQLSPEKMPEVTSRAGLSMNDVSTPESGPHEFLLFGDMVPLGTISCYICRVKFRSCASAECGSTDPIPRDSTDSKMCPYVGDAGATQEGSLQPHIQINRKSLRQEALDENGQDMTMKFSPGNSTDNLSNQMPSVVSLRQDGNVGVISPPAQQSRRPSFIPNSLRDPTTRHSTEIVRRSTDISQRRGDEAGTPQSKLTQRKFSVRVPKNNHHDDDDRNSIGSSSRASSSTRGGSSTNFVKRAIAIKNEQSSIRLFRFHLSFILCIIGLIAFAIYETTDFKGVMNSLNFQILQVNKRGRSTADLMSAISCARIIDLWRVGGYWPYSISQLPVDYARGAILHIVATLREDSQLYYDFGKVNITVPIYDSNNIEPAPALELLTSVLDALHYVGTAGLNDMFMKDRLQFVLTNGISYLGYGLNYSSGLQRDKFENFYSGKPTATMLKAMIGPIVSLIIICGLIGPLYMSMEESREQFLRMFYDIPKEVAKGIYESNYQRLLDSQEEDDDNDFDVTTKFEIDKVLGSDTAINIQSDVNFGRSQASNSSKFHERSLMERIGYWFYDQHKVGVKAMFLFVLSCVYFFSTATVLLYFLLGIRGLSNQLYWTAQRPALLYQSIFLLRERFVDMVTSQIPNNNSIATYWGGMTYPSPTEILQSLEWIDNSLIYGSDIMNILPIIQMDSSSTDYYFEFVTACTEASPDDCMTYWNGLCSQGIHHMLDYYIMGAKGLDKSLTTLKYSQNVPIDTIVELDTIVGLLGQFAYNYSSIPLLAVVENHANDVNTRTDWFNNFQMIFTIIFVVALVFVYFVIVRPLIASLDEDVKRTSALVYMLPPAIFATVPSFKHWVENHENRLRTPDSRKRKEKRKDKDQKDVIQKSEQKIPLTKSDTGKSASGTFIKPTILKTSEEV